MGGNVAIGIRQGQQVPIGIIPEDGRASQGIHDPGEPGEEIIAELGGPAKGIGLALSRERLS